MKSMIFLFFCHFKSSFEWLKLFVLDIDGLGDMRPIYGITVAEKKDKQGREGKVIRNQIFLYYLKVLLFSF